MMRYIYVLFGAGVVLGGGCAVIDPLTRAGVWRPDHANHADLLVMAARPADVRLGRGEALADGQLAARAVARLRLDAVKPLPQSGLAEITMQGAAPGAAPGSPGAALAAPGGAPIP